jgi:ubiquinone biosynthesis protein
VTKNIRFFFRLLFIFKVLARNASLFPLESFKVARFVSWYYKIFSNKYHNVAAGMRLAKSFEELGPVFIKFGQALSTRADLIGIETATGLAHLRDNLPAFDFNVAKSIIENELSIEIDKEFLSFSDNPVNAASISQVHKAVTKDNKVVAIKVRRPNIEEQFYQDIELFYFLARIIEKKIPKYRRLKLIEVVDTFARSVKLEMDFRFEASAASELKENFISDDTIYIPQIFWQYTSHKVLTLEWIEGIPINDKIALDEAGYDVEQISSNLSVMFFNQAYRDGFFHADLHAGNIFINNYQQIVLIDFGIMGRLDKQTKLYVAEILRGFLTRDYVLVAKVHFDAGYVPKYHNIHHFAQSCRSIGEPIVGLPANEISIAKLLAQLFKVTEDFDMETQPQLLLLQKTMMMVEGIGISLNPKVNMWQVAEPWIEKWAIENIGIEAKFLEFINKIIDIIKGKKVF